MGRPKDNDSYPIPLSLFHSEFAQFKQDIVSGPRDSDLSPLAYKWVKELSEFFDDKKKREATFLELLSELLGHKISKQQIGSYTTDGGTPGLGTKPIVVKIKNETTVGLSDAFLEVVLYDLHTFG